MKNHLNLPLARLTKEEVSELPCISEFKQKVLDRGETPAPYYVLTEEELGKKQIAIEETSREVLLAHLRTKWKCSCHALRRWIPQAFEVPLAFAANFIIIDFSEIAERVREVKNPTLINSLINAVNNPPMFQFGFWPTAGGSKYHDDEGKRESFDIAINGVKLVIKSMVLLPKSKSRMQVSLLDKNGKLLCSLAKQIKPIDPQEDIRVGTARGMTEELIFFLFTVHCIDCSDPGLAIDRLNEIASLS